MNLTNLPGFFKNLPAFWLFLLLPVLVLLYLLKLRREDRLISSTYLWQKMIRDMEANTPWQKLRRNLLLLLQLLFLGVLIFSIARPYLKTPGFNSQTAVLIMDISASMAATDIQPNRLESAKQTANQIVEELPAEARISVITAGEKSRTIISLSTDRRGIHQAIDQISLSTGGCNLGIALQIAKAIAERQPDVQIIILSDGNVELPERITISGIVRFISIGVKKDNQAIQMLNLQTNPSDHSLSAFAQVTNYSPSPVKRRLAFFADGTLANAFDLNLAPNGEQAILAEGIISTTQVIEARLMPDSSGADYLGLDDHAYAIPQPVAPEKVVLVSDGNLFLETALKLLPYLELEVLKPEQPVDAAAGLVIYDGLIPGSPELPAGNLLFIAPPASTSLFTVTGMLQLPEPVAVEPVDPLIEHINLGGINILDAVNLVQPTWSKVLIADAKNQAPLLLAGESAGRRIAILTFDLHRSDFPLQVGFPLLVSNLINWLTPGSQTPRQVAPGDALIFSEPLATSDQVATLQITRPDGTTAQYNYLDGKVVFADTGELGVYKVDSGDGEISRFAVNLFSPQESQLEPQTAIQIAGITPAAGSSLQQNGEKELWRLVAGLALLLLVIEWLVYQRPVMAMLVQRVRSISKKSGLNTR
jgi:von Willebrand factor type A domain/Aerotolerance regulator N-terminal